MMMMDFLYGLAFIVLSAVVFILPKREDPFGLGKSMIFIGWFALLHGLNKWVDLLMLNTSIFSSKTLSAVGGVLMPLSFVFLIIFGCVAISNMGGSLKWFSMAWIVLPLLWAGLSIKFADLLVPRIFTRYVLCLPGAILTSLAIYLSLKRVNVRAVPKSTTMGGWTIIISFLLYGVFSGIITPKAHFFTASALNYPNFIELFHLPIQFLRMACAIAISFGFILLTGNLNRRKPGIILEGAIRRKIILVTLFSMLLVTLVGSIPTYFSGTAILMRITGREYSQLAHTLNIYTVDVIRSEVDDAKTYATRLLWKDTIEESNARYAGMNTESIRKKLLDMDRIWSTAKPGDTLLNEYLENRISVGMRETLLVRSNVSEIFITDKYGGIVAASGKTTDFYQADEEWWQKAYDGGKGAIYVSDIEFDESSKDWVISIAVPMKNARGEVIGICKDSAGIDRLFGNLADFKLGNTGHAILVDGKGMAIFHHGVSTMAEKVLPEKILRAIPNMKNPYFVLRNTPFRDKEVFCAFSELKVPYMSDSGASWIVLVVQDMSEVYGPIQNFISQILVIALLMMALIMPIAASFGRIVSGPIDKLRLATEKIIAGDWEAKIDINTGDEIEQFADLFKDMMADIRSKQKRLESFSSGLEAIVEERTKELSGAQEAALNILEDLQASRDSLERTNRELVKLDELKSGFISTVSHELRTPLSIIKEGISLVLDKIPGDVNEKQSKILEISKYNIDRLARIIDSLLDISKMEAGKLNLKRGLIDISKVVRDVAKSFESKIRKKGLEMRLDIDDVTGSVWADPDGITQVLTNLIANAIRFTSAGQIGISCKDKGDGVVCSVSDTGVGISKKDMPKVFEKFQQFGRTAGAGDKGTGLGLSIVKSMIDLHNGAIWVESEPGKGSSFTFKLHKHTSQSLFREHVSKAFKKAVDQGSPISIIAVAASITAEDTTVMPSKKLNDIMHESARLMKDMLKREDDDVINSGDDIIVILADCDRDGAGRVQYKLEELVDKYLASQNADGLVKINYGYATYPDDAKSDLELIEKAKAALAFSAKA